MDRLRIHIEPPRVAITVEEILADLNYPAKRGPAAAPGRSRRAAGPKRR